MLPGEPWEGHPAATALHTTAKANPNNYVVQIRIWNRSGRVVFLACVKQSLEAIDDRLNFGLVLPQLVN